MQHIKLLLKWASEHAVFSHSAGSESPEYQAQCEWFYHQSQRSGLPQGSWVQLLLDGHSHTAVSRNKS